MIISSHKEIVQNKPTRLKKNLKSTKIVSSIFRKFYDKQPSNFKKLSGTASSNAKIISNYKKVNQM